MSKAIVWCTCFVFAAALFSGTPTPAVQIDWVIVDGAGNPADWTGLGAVTNEYRIGKYEVTNDQYAEFLSSVAANDVNGLYHSNMDISRTGPEGNYSYASEAGFASKPVNHVSFVNAMRFANWLENGQPTGSQTATTTEDGTYSITTGLNETRAFGASYFLPSENEWYKAVYHKNDGPTGNYWLYPTQSNSSPDASGPTSAAHSANYNSAVGDTTEVGAYPGSEGPYGTFDQGGNLWEWTESTFQEGNSRGLRGGSWVRRRLRQASQGANSRHPSYENSNIGFRVAATAPILVAAPEPTTLLLLTSAVLALLVCNVVGNKSVRDNLKLAQKNRGRPERVQRIPGYCRRSRIHR